jgi:uncharacterized membrane protein YdfJ with MMPL/SSD domain
VPKNAEATAVAERSTRLFGTPLVTDTMVVQRDPEGLSVSEQRRTVLAAREVSERPERDLALIAGALPIGNVFGLLSERGEQSTTAVTYLFFSPKAGLEERDEDAHKYVRRYLARPEAHVVGVTGAAPARLAQFEEIEDSLPLIEIASVLLIALIVGVHFRSLTAPLVTLVAAGISYLVAIRALAWGGEQVDLGVAQEVEPLVLVLLLGLVTDYSVFFMSAMRRGLGEGEDVTAAARGATARTVPVVVAAGLIVAGGVAALVVGRLDFFQAFGPSLAITTLVALAVSITLIPAARRQLRASRDRAAALVPRVRVRDGGGDRDRHLRRPPPADPQPNLAVRRGELAAGAPHPHPVSRRVPRARGEPLGPFAGGGRRGKRGGARDACRANHEEGETGARGAGPEAAPARAPDRRLARRGLPARGVPAPRRRTA